MSKKRQIPLDEWVDIYRNDHSVVQAHCIRVKDKEPSKDKKPKYQTEVRMTIGVQTMTIGMFANYGVAMERAYYVNEVLKSIADGNDFDIRITTEGGITFNAGNISTCHIKFIHDAEDAPIAESAKWYARQLKLALMRLQRVE